MIENQITLDNEMKCVTPRRQTTPNPSRPLPQQVVLSEANVTEALSLYMDYIFDAPPGTYQAKSIDMFGLQASVYLKQSEPK